jgi:flagellar basal body-associated protein FliL
MKPWLLLVAALSVCLVAQPSFASGAKAGKTGKESKEGKKAEGGKAPKKQRPITSLESWVMVDPFSVTVVQEDRIRGKVLVSFGMDVPDAELREKAELVMPRLQDAWLSQLNLYAATTVRPGKPANITEVSNILQTVADRVLGKPGSKVLLASVIINMQ